MFSVFETIRKVKKDTKGTEYLNTITIAFIHFSLSYIFIFIDTEIFKVFNPTVNKKMERDSQDWTLYLTY